MLPNQGDLTFSKFGKPFQESLVQLIVEQRIFADQIEDGLPVAIRQRQGLGELGDSLRKVHFPTSTDEVAVARRRLAFGELFDLQLRLARLRKKRLEQHEGIALEEVRTPSGKPGWGKKKNVQHR